MSMKNYICENCKEVFVDYACNNRVNCSKDCHKESQKRLTGKDNPRYTRIRKECKVCGKEFIVQRCRKDTAKFCTKKCSEIDRDEGKSTKYKRIRKSKEYKLWRKAVFERDDYTCIWCGQRGGYLNADHIKPFALFPELRFAIDNGRTLCVDCHKKTGTWGRYKMFRKA